MMNQDEGDLSLNLMRAVMEGQPDHEIRVIGKGAKRAIWKQWIRLVTEANVIDTIVAKYAPDLNWRWGVQDPDLAPSPASAAPLQTQPTATSVGRKARILDIAKQLWEEGRTVSTVEIADRLQREGEKIPMKNLTTSVGNTLSRNGWRRVREGEYEPEEEAEEVIG